MNGLERRRRLARLERRLMGAMGRCIQDFDLLAPGDRVMVAVSGGKDSITLLHLLQKVQARAPFKFELIAVTLDQGQPGFDPAPLQAWMAREGHDHRLLQANTYKVVLDKVPEGKTYCSLCSRLRRGVLYDRAVELGCTKIALGHHRDDLVETLLLNALYAGQLKAMPPRLESDDGRNTVIRPLAYAIEAEIAEYAALLEFPILPCNLCGSQPNLQRQKMKRLLDQLEAENPKVRSNILAALGNVRPSHLLDPAITRVGGEPDDGEAGGSDACGTDASPPRLVSLGRSG